MTSGSPLGVLLFTLSSSSAEADFVGISTVVVESFSRNANTSGCSVMVGDIDLDIEVDSFFVRPLLSVRPVDDRVDLGGFGREIDSCVTVELLPLEPPEALVISDRMEMTEGDV